VERRLVHSTLIALACNVAAEKGCFNGAQNKGYAMDMLERLEKIQKTIEETTKALRKAIWIIEEINKFHPRIVEDAVESYERRKR